MSTTKVVGVSSFDNDFCDRPSHEYDGDFNISNINTTIKSRVICDGYIKVPKITLKCTLKKKSSSKSFKKGGAVTTKKTSKTQSIEEDVTLYDRSGGEYADFFKSTTKSDNEHKKYCGGKIPFDYASEGKIRKEVMMNTYTVEEESMMDGWIKQKSTGIVNSAIQNTALNLFKSQHALKLYGEIGNSCNSAIMLTNPPGTGKTLNAVWGMMEIFASMHRSKFGASKMKVALISYTTNVVHDEMRKYVEIGYNSINNFHLTKHAQGDDETRGTQTFMDFDSYGYKTYASRIIEVMDIERFNQTVMDNKTMDPIKMLFKAVDDKIIIIRWDIIQLYNNSILIIDESHGLQNPGYTNKNGLTILLVRTFTRNYLIYISASIFNGDISELAYVQRLILDRPYPYEKCFTPEGNIIPDWRTKIIPLFKGYVIFSGNPDSINIPKHEYVGNNVALRGNELFKHIEPEYNFYFVPLTQDMIDYKTIQGIKPVSHDSYLFMLKVSDPKSPTGVRYIVTRNDIMDLIKYPAIAPDLHISMGEIIGGNKEPSIVMGGPMLKYENLDKCSPMMRTVLNIMFNYDGEFKQTMIKDEGKIRIHGQGVDLPGVPFIGDVLRANGLVEDGKKPSQNSICLACLRKKIAHKHMADLRDLGKFYHHNPKLCDRFKPIYFIIIHAYIDVNKRLARFNRGINSMGEMLKVLIVTNVIDLSRTISDTKYTFETSIPKHVTNMIQSHHRTIRSGSFNALVGDQGYTYFPMFYNAKNPDDYSRQMISIADKFKSYNQIKEAWILLRNLSSDRDMYKNTQLTHPKIDRSKISDANYYASGAAHDYRSELISMIRQLFNEYQVLSLTCIRHMIRKKVGLKTNINTNVFTDDDITAALNVLVRQTSSVDLQYLESTVSLVVLFKMLSCNVIINDGRKGKVVYRGTDNAGEQIYSFVACLNQQDVVQHRLPKNYRPLESTLLLTEESIDDVMSVATVISLLSTFMVQHKEAWYLFASMFTYREKISMIRVAITSWGQLSDTARGYIMLFVKSREVFLAADLKRVVAEKWLDNNAPVGYLEGGEIKYYVHLPHNKQGSGTWKSTVYVAVFNEVINNSNFYAFLDSKSSLKIVHAGQAKPHQDNRRNTSGVQCHTIRINVLKELLSKLYKNVDFDGIVGVARDISTLDKVPLNICKYINTITLQADLKQYDQYVKLGGNKSSLTFNRYIYILNHKKNWTTRMVAKK